MAIQLPLDSDVGLSQTKQSEICCCEQYLILESSGEPQVSELLVYPSNLGRVRCVCVCVLSAFKFVSGLRRTVFYFVVWVQSDPSTEHASK